MKMEEHKMPEDSINLVPESLGTFYEQKILRKTAKSHCVLYRSVFLNQ